MEEDLAAIDHLHWMVAQDIGGWGIDEDVFGDGSYHTPCRTCDMCIDCDDCECRNACVEAAPLRVPFAEIARVA